MRKRAETTMQNDAWQNYFADIAQRAGLMLSEKQLSLFLAYMLELLEWNRRTNLTRIVEPRAIAVKHFLDSMLIAEMTPRCNTRTGCPALRPWAGRA